MRCSAIGRGGGFVRLRGPNCRHGRGPASITSSLPDGRRPRSAGMILSPTWEKPSAISIARWTGGRQAPRTEKMADPASFRQAINLALAAPLILLVRLYRLFVSPLIGANCRHLPTCSEYAIEALRRHGPLRGGFYALKRISRCHPWAKPAFDPVPGTGNGDVTRHDRNNS